MTYRGNAGFGGKLGGPQGKKGYRPNPCSKCGRHHRRPRGVQLCLKCDPVANEQLQT